MHARGQGSLERSTSPPRVHKRCQCKNATLCMQAMKWGRATTIARIVRRARVKKAMYWSRGQNAK
eukprot:6213961-Pleurochrysis_carterae.AAC.3